MITVKSFLFTLALLCSVKQSNSVTEEFQVSITCQQDYLLNRHSTCVMRSPNYHQNSYLVSLNTSFNSGRYQGWSKWTKKMDVTFIKVTWYPENALNEDVNSKTIEIP